MLEYFSHLQEGEPLLQFFHWKHLHSDEAHALNHRDNGGRVVHWILDLLEEPASDRVKSSLAQHSYDLCIQVSDLSHVRNIWVGVSSVSEMG